MEIKRAAELTLCSLLNAGLTGLKFRPSKGIPSDPTPVPPFGVVIVDRAEKTLAREKVHIVSGQAIWITRADATNSETHSDTFQDIYNFLIELDPDSGYDPETDIIVHGITVLSTGQYTDEARQAHGDIVIFSMGVTERFT